MIKRKYVKIIGAIGTAMIMALSIAGCSNNSSSKVNTEKPAVNNEEKSEENKKPESNIKVVEGPKFEKVQLDKNTQVTFATPWRHSASGKFSACIEGKGPEAHEEGIAKVYAKENSGSMWSLQLEDKSKKNTPMYLEWWDDENLLVIIGYGYGTVSLGGNLYVVNINSAKSAVLVENKNSNNEIDPKQQITKVTKENDNIRYDMIVYEDDNLIKYNKDSKVLSNYTDTMKAITSELK